MKQLTVIGMAIIILAFTGCVKDNDFQSLKITCTSLSEEVTRLREQIKAVEQACLQINTRLIDIETRRAAPATQASQPPASQPEATSEKETKNISSPNDSASQPAPSPDANEKFMRSSFSRRMSGLTLAEVTSMLGKPDKVTEESGATSWIYGAVKLTTKDGKPDVSPAMIVFEQGQVSRAVLLEEVQYSSEPAKPEPGSKTTDSNATSGAGSSPDTGK
jgi:TolA-binding protein